MNLLLWLVGGAIACFLVALWLVRHIRQTNAALREERERREQDRLEDERRASREAAEREANRLRVAAQQSARAESRRRAESPPAPAAPAAVPVARAPAPKPAAAPSAPPVPAVVVPEQPVAAQIAEPVAPPQPSAPQASAAQASATQASATQAALPMVMVADDSKVVRVKTGRILAQHPFRVCFASDGAEALQAIQACPPQVLITDVDMPGLDGFELTRRLRADPATARMPVIMITAADATHRAAAKQAGVDVVLGKPFSEEDLISHVQAAVQRRVPEGRAAPALTQAV